MGERYNHLTELDRVFLHRMLDKGYPKTKIANNLKVNRSTIYREIKRNSWVHWANKETIYTCSIAQQKYLRHRKRPLKLEQDKNLREEVHKKLKLGWSPWQIEGRFKLDNNDEQQISHEAIYRYIYSNYNRRNNLYRCLRRKHIARIKHGSRVSRVPSELLIQNRPFAINNREEFGHWECDLMIFKKEASSNLITLTERKTRFVIAIKNANKQADTTALNLISTLKGLKPYIRSITFDQGSEFAKFDWIKDCLNVSVYFCNAGAPYQKGSIENRNGVLRVELPRSYDIDRTKQRHINKLTNIINNRPMECLGFLTPNEAFEQFAVGAA